MHRCKAFAYGVKRKACTRNKPLQQISFVDKKTKHLFDKIMKQIPNKSFWSLWNISFGFFGVQIAYALQSANISSIFTALGADPHSLSFFWILPPLMGMIVQPIIGTLSDKTWTRYGRRIPYLFVGAVLAVAVMCLLPEVWD